MDNPYKAPTAALRDTPAPPRSRILAVLAGLGVDMGGSLVAGIVFGIGYGAILASRGADAEQIGNALTELDPSSGYFILSTAVGLCFSCLGGYVCARVAKRDERRLAAILAALTTVLGLALGSMRLGLGLNALMLGLTFGVVMAGSELGRRRNVAQAGQPAAATAA